jgi:hypothetical protein
MSGTLICGKTTGNAVVPVQVNADGTLEMTAEIDSSALAKETTLDSFRTENASNLGAIDSSLSDGTLEARCMGINGTTQTQLAVESNGSLVIGGGAVKTAVSTVDGSTQHIQVDSTGALLVRTDNSNDSVRIVGQNSAGANKGVGVEDTDGGILSAGKVVVATPTHADGSRQLLRLNASGELMVNDSSGGGGGGSAATNTYDSTPVSVLAPINPGDPPLITPSQRFDLTNVKQINAITLWTTAVNFTDVSRVGLEYSYDGTNYFSDLGSAASPSFSTTQDLNGNTRVDPVGGINPIYIDTSLFPDQDRAQYFRIVFEHSNQAGADVSIVPIIVFGGI